jgi:hypothetical protein
MKLADELRRESRRSPITLYYETLLRDMRLEAREGGNHKIVQIAPTYYNNICQRLLKEGFEVRIYNYKVDNPSHMVYIIWDKERFDESLKDNDDIDLKNFHYGLI